MITSTLILNEFTKIHNAYSVIAFELHKYSK